MAGKGLSPLTRGNPSRLPASDGDGGPIPAHAGQPGLADPLGHQQGAYPRSRGATRTVRGRLRGGRGLSPLTRGNLRALFPSLHRSGPIPAHAGQPRATGPAARFMWAYPRSRGATAALLVLALPSWGLSPLTRGNLPAQRVGLGHLGPIPAHAGQPPSRPPARPSARAYPRSRGATQRAQTVRRRRKGLSPLTRGNLLCSSSCRTRENFKTRSRF